MIQNPEIQKREQWLDIAKAICITAMVIGHIGVPFVQYIYTFHMAAFFILSGYTYSGEKYTWLFYCRKKINTLLLPMFAVNILFLGFYALTVKCGLYSYVETPTYTGFVQGLSGLFSIHLSGTELGGATWFLPVLFIAELVFKTIQECFYESKYHIAVAMLLGLTGYYLSAEGVYLPFGLDLGLYACFYFSLGVFFKRQDVLQKINFRYMLPVSVLAELILVKYHFSGRLPMNWPTRQFDNILIQFISVFCGFYLCCFLAKRLTGLKKTASALSYLGQHTFTVLAFHFLIFRCITLGVCLTGKLPLSALKVFPLAPELSSYWFIIAPATILFCVLLSWLGAKNVITDFIVNGKKFYPPRITRKANNIEVSLQVT